MHQNPHHIGVPEDYSLLLQPEFGVLLARCYAGPQSVGTLAQLVNQKPNTVYRRVQKLVRAGVLKVERAERRAGKTIKFYAPTQETFDIPFAGTPFDSYADYAGQRLSGTLQANLNRAYSRLDSPEKRLALRVFYRAGVMQIDPVLDGKSTSETYHEVFGTANVIHRWIPLHLTPTELTELNAELQHLTARYFRPFQEGDEQTAALGLFLLPN